MSTESRTESITERWKHDPEVMKRLIPASEIKRRGISMVDPLLAEGPVYIIKNDRIEYVVMGRATYEDVLEDQDEASDARVRQSLEELARGEGRIMTVEEIMAEARANA
jgi:PHD/YefM family antitoxin component YafN of YafNO toxin-antitoxin module